MPSLYELTQDVMELQALLEEGVIDDSTFSDTIESLDIDTKVENICKVMKNLERKAEAYKVEIDRMSARKKTLDNNVDRLKKSLLDYMNTANTKKVEAGLFTVSVGSSKSVNVYRPDLIPQEYLIEQDPKVDKTGISKALKNGESVLGAELIENKYVTIR